jgi:hypothetical protein
MARAPNKPKSQLNVKSVVIPEGMTVKEFKLEPTEDELDRKHRIWKDKLSFLVKDLLAYILALLLVFCSMIYSFWILAHQNLPKDDRQFAMSLLTALGTAVVGFVFGKATK